MEERAGLLLDFIISVFLPDFEPMRDLLLKAVEVTFAFLGHKSYKELVDILADNLENLGFIFGVNPQLL